MVYFCLFLLALTTIKVNTPLSLLWQLCISLILMGWGWDRRSAVCFSSWTSHWFWIEGGTSRKEPICQCRRHWDAGSITGSGRSPEGGHGNPFQYSCLENPMDRGARQLTVMGSRGVEHYWSNLACTHTCTYSGFPGGVSGKEPDCQCRRHKRCGFHPWIGKIPWRRAWQPTPIFLPGISHEEPEEL